MMAQLGDIDLAAAEPAPAGAAAPARTKRKRQSGRPGTCYAVRKKQQDR